MTVRPRHLLGLACLSAGGLLFEISTTRVLSALYFYNYVYLVLSVAVLGLGVGAALATWRPAWRAAERLTLWPSLAALSALGFTVLVSLTTGVDARYLLLAVGAVPYIFIGLTLAAMFSLHAEASPQLYWADLSGAGLGTLLTVPVLNAVGGLNGTLVAACLLAGSSLALTRPFSRVRGMIALVVVGVLTINLGSGVLELDLAGLATPKPVQTQLQAGGEITATRWDAFARTDLVYRPDQDAYYLYVDGAAASLVPGAEHAQVWQRDIGFFPFLAGEPESAMLIGPGGGLDVALARAANVSEISAVEINPASIALTRTLDTYTGGVFEEAEVKIDEGRSALLRSERDYDLIFLSQVVTQAAEARGYALTENSVYTVEAFRDYLDHLSPDGQIALKLYDELTLTRAFTTAVQALRERGLSEAEAARHLFALLDTRASPPIPLLVVRREAYSRDEAIRQARIAEELELALLFIPELFAQPPLDGLLAGETSLEEIIAASADADVRPTRDNWPFFYQFQPGIPDQLRPLVYGLAVVVLLSATGLILKQRHEPVRAVRWSPVLIAGLGVGFMATEVAMLQRVKLFLGHPTLTLSVILGTLLIVGGLGSMLAGRVKRLGESQLITLSALGVVMGVAVWSALWPSLAENFRAGGVPLRVLVTVLSVAPVALVMGMPFPLALRALGRYGASPVALAWAVNGLMSVVGGVIATVLALLYGFASVSLVGIGSYLVVMVLAGLAWWRTADSRASTETDLPGAEQPA